MFINWQARELNLKIVYYGPALSGKTTNLEQIYRTVNPTRRSNLVSLKTQEDRTLFFDFMQLELGKISGLLPKIHLYTVPGQIYYEASRRLVLRGVDGIVFVVDSSKRRLPDAIESWKDLFKHLKTLDIPYNRVPIVFQANKQDVPDALPPAAFERIFHMQGRPVIPAVASRNKGVSDTLKTIINLTVKSVQQKSH